MRKSFKVFITVIIIALLVGCGGFEHSTIPTTPVKFTIYPNDLTHQNLNYFGGYEYYTGGVAGIVIYRLNWNTFCIYDRACPYDWQHDEGWVWVDPGGLTLTCKRCGSIFNILDGGVIDGPSPYQLKYYRYAYDGVQLRVYN